ncbi:MAG: choice-of-anchor D domain-containing protein [Acidimicrobiia bacterium]
MVATLGVAGSLALMVAGAPAAAADGLPLLISPTSFDFGDVMVGTQSTPQSVNVVNRGTAPVVLNPSGGGAGKFAGSTNCPATLPPGGSCQISYAFAPDALGAATATTGGSLGGQAFSFAFQGNGIARLSVTPTGLDFGDVPVGTTSPSQSVNIKNITNGPVTLSVAGGAAGAFGGSSDCPGVLAAGATCHLTYAFTPAAAGAVTGNTNGNLSGQPFALTFKGNGRAATDAFLITPTAFDFGDIPVGSTAVQQVVDIKNVTNATMPFNGSGGAAGLFGGSTNCPATLASGASCQFFYAFTPTAGGLATGSTNGTINGQPFSFSFRGNAINRYLISPIGFDFGDTPAGIPTDTQYVTLTNKGLVPVVRDGTGGAAGIFGGGIDCPATIGVGESCTFQYRLQSNTPGPATGSTSGTMNGQPFALTFKGNVLAPGSAVAPNQPQNVNAAVNGSQAFVSWTQPATNGGAVITEYRVTSSPGGVSVTVPSTSTSTLVDLAPGVSTTYTVRAVNSAGISLGTTSNAVVRQIAGSPVDYVPLNPERLLDTRAQVGYVGAKPGAGDTVSLKVTGVGVSQVPADASAVVLNVTGTEATADGFVTVSACGGSVPNASNLNLSTGATTPNLVIAKIGVNGSVCLFTYAGTHLIADIAGYFPATSSFGSFTPERLLDTRSAVGYSGAKPVAGQVVELAVTGVGASQVPGNASAVVLNLTATEADGDGYVAAFPCGGSVPDTSSLNVVTGGTTPNLVIAKVGTGGKVCLFTYAATHLIADIAGYFPATSSYVSLVPERLLDSRSQVGYSGGKPTGGQTVELQVTGVGSSQVPGSASAVVLNLTGTEATGDGYLSAFPCGTTPPDASNVNLVAGGTSSNLVIVKLGAGGKACLFTYAGAHLVADVVGYFPSPS